MASFAKIENGVVTDITKILDVVVGSEYPASEPVGQAFIASIGLGGEWLQTSFAAAFRKREAQIGGTYDAEKDEFVYARQFDSWTLDENNDWQPPVAMPTSEGNWHWNESEQTWVNLPLI